jgi:hypothetical protein
MTAQEGVATEVRLREEFREAIRTLSNARRAEAWAILNELVALAREDR